MLESLGGACSLSGLYCSTAYRILVWIAMRGMGVLLVMPGCSVFHILMVVGRDDCFI